MSGGDVINFFVKIKSAKKVFFSTMPANPNQVSFIEKNWLQPISRIATQIKKKA
jgi:hypothetical protein